MRSRIRLAVSLMATGAVVITVAAPPLLEPANGSPIAVADGPGNVVFGDVNKDGKPDLAVASAQGRRVTILLGLGDGRFSPAPGGAVAVPDGPTEMVLSDIDGDGNLDLALGSHDSYAVTLLMGDGRGGFRPAANSPVVMKNGRQPHTHGLGVADFNGDGRTDLATVNSNDDNDVAVVLVDGHGKFTPAPASPFGVGRAPYPMALGDLDGDGSVDMVVTSTGIGASAGSDRRSSDGLTALMGDGRGGFKRSGIPSRTPRTWFAEVGDLNGDRKPDLLATHTENRLLSVLIGDGRGSFIEVPGSPFDLGANAWAVRLADINRDGKMDAVAAAGTGVRVLLGDGRGSFAPAPGSPFATGKGTWKVAVADVNSDGKPDVATSNLESNTVMVLLGR